MNSLVDYGSSDSESSESVQKQNNRLPNLLLFDQTTNLEEDNSELHEGRTRSVKHERGNWATFVYTPVPNIDLIQKIQSELIDLITTETNLQIHKTKDDFHISLTKLLILRHHWIDNLVEKINLKIEDFKR